MSRQLAPLLSWCAALLLAAVGCTSQIDTSGDGGKDDPNALPIELPVGSDGSPEPGPSPSAEPPPSPDAGPSAEPEPPPPPQACTQWQDCGPYFGDQNSGYECVSGTCTCDPTAEYAANCSALGGGWNAGDCYCEFLDIGGECQIWQDCGPYYDSNQSGFDCVSNTCTCDPAGTYSQNCVNQGGQWVQQECYCVFTDVPYPTADPEPDCWWHYVQDPCDPDEWVDTSYYREECYYDSNDNRVCNSVYVPDGYWRDGACPAPWWELRCYGAGTARPGGNGTSG